MKRVCMLVTSELSHDPRVTKEAQITFEAGYNVSVICRENLGYQAPYKIITFGVRKPSSRILKYAERFFSLLLIFWLTLRERPDLIHANDLDTLPVAFLAGKLLRAKIVYDSHELWPDVNANLRGISGKIASQLQTFIARRIDGVITVNEYLGNVMAQRMSIKPPLVVLNAPYLRGHEKIQPGEWIQQFRGKKIALYLSRYIPHRGIWDVIESAKYLPEDIVVVFRGYGPLENEMRKRVTEANLDNKVFFLPPVPMEEIVSASMGADVALVLYDPVHDSHRNVSPNKLFQYMMAGVPVVCSDMVFLRKMVTELNIGELYTPGNAESLASAIANVVSDKKRHQEMVSHCLHYREQFCWEVEGKKLIDLYQTLLCER